MTKDSSEDLAEGQRIEALQQAAQVFALYRPGVPELSLKELAASLGMKPPSAHRVVANLEHAGLLEQGRGGGYRLGRPLWRLGLQTLHNREVWDEAKEVVKGLVRDTGAVALIAVYHDGEAIYIEQVRSGGEALGRAFPAHATALGKVLLAHLQTAELRRAISERGLEAFTANTITDAGRLDQELAEVRARGYALEDAEYLSGQRALGAPARDHAGQVIAAVGIGGDTDEIPAGRLEHLAERVVAAASDLSLRLGAGESAALAPIRLRVERRGGPRDPQAIITREPVGAPAGAPAGDRSSAEAPVTEPAFDRGA